MDDFLKFIPFLFTVKKSRAQRHTGPLQAPSQWLSARFSSSMWHRSASLLTDLLIVLQDVENKQVEEILYLEQSYHWILCQVSNGNFALASIFLRGRTSLPVLVHLICRLNGGCDYTLRSLTGKCPDFVENQPKPVGCRSDASPILFISHHPRHIENQDKRNHFTTLGILSIKPISNIVA